MKAKRVRCRYITRRPAVITVDIAIFRGRVEVIIVQRNTDPSTRVHFHAERIHCINGLWYYLTREGANVGPFATKESAKKHLVEFLGTGEKLVTKKPAG